MASYRPQLLPTLLFALLLLAVPARDAAAQLEIGIVGGANFTTLADVTSNGDPISFATATGYHAGIFLDLSFGPIGFRPGAYYLNAGALFEGAPFLEQSNFGSNFDLGYVSLMADLHYTLGAGPIKPYLFIGPEFRTLFSATQATLDLEENLDRFVVNLTGGVGFEIKFGQEGPTLYPHVRFIRGLQGLTDEEYGVGDFLIITDGNTENMWLIGLGLKF